VGVFGDDFEHPRAVLIDHRKGQVGVFLGEIFLAEFELAVLVGAEKMTLDFLAPLDHHQSFWLLPGGVEFVAMEKLLDASVF
jgi:hypothetical protein